MSDSEQVDSILQHTPEPERDELAEDFRTGRMSVDEFIFGEDDDAAMRRAGVAGSTASGCTLMVLTLLFGVVATPALVHWGRDRVCRGASGNRIRISVTVAHGIEVTHS